MIMTILAFAIVGGLTYLWLTRGFFSALLHLVCVIIAGAVAFAFWEPLAYLILKSSPTKGFLVWLGGSSYAIALIVAFAVSLVVLRVIADKVVPGNAQAEKVPDMIGGGICGFMSGMITAGITIIGVGSLWIKQDSLGYQRLSWSGADSAFRSDKRVLLIKPDDFVAALYGGLSKTVFEPKPEAALARQYPALADVPSAYRRTRDSGRGKPFLRPSDVSLERTFTVGLTADGRTIEGSQIENILRSRGEITETADNLRVMNRKGQNIAQDGAHTAGYIVSFSPTAREKAVSQIAFTPAQGRLVCVNDEGDAVEVFPIAFISRIDPGNAGDPNVDGIVAYERYTLTDDQGLGTVAGDGAPRMGLEFLVPKGYKAASLYVKNLRVDVRNRKVDVRFASGDDRQTAVDSGSVFGGAQTPVNEANAQVVVMGGNFRSKGITTGASMQPRTTLQSGSEGGLTVSKERKIIAGEATFNVPDMKRFQIDRALRVDSFEPTPGTKLIHVFITPSQGAEEPAIDFSKPPLRGIYDRPMSLVDTENNRYPCIGYVYQGQRLGGIRFTRSNPLQGLADVPERPGPTVRNLQVVLLFEITEGANIIGFAMGDDLMIKFDEPQNFN